MGEGYKGVSIYWIEEWSQFVHRCNWYTFHPVKIEIEDERNMGGLEMTIILLGFGIRVRWNYAETEQVESIVAQVNAIRERADSDGF